MSLDFHYGRDWGGDAFADLRKANTDGSLTPLPEDDTLLSVQRCCDRCGVIFDDKWKIHKSGRKHLCRICVKG